VCGSQRSGDTDLAWWVAVPGCGCERPFLGDATAPCRWLSMWLPPLRHHLPLFTCGLVLQETLEVTTSHRRPCPRNLSLSPMSCAAQSSAPMARTVVSSPDPGRHRHSRGQRATDALLIQVCVPCFLFD
jgi:hypothetical protein